MSSGAFGRRSAVSKLRAWGGLPPAGFAVTTGALRRIHDVGVQELREYTDEELLVMVPGEPDALEELYRKCVDRTVAFAIRRCETAEEAHDLVAATWLEVIDASPRFDPARGKAVPSIMGVMANLANDRRRRRAREQEALRRLGGLRVLDSDDILRLEEVIDASRLAGPLERGFGLMPALEREALELVAFGSVSQEEAAAALGVAPATFRMRLSRARKRLRQIASIDDVEVVTS